MVRLETSNLPLADLELDKGISASAVRFFFANTDLLGSKNLALYRLAESARVWDWNTATVNYIKYLIHAGFQNEDRTEPDFDGSAVWGRL